MVEVQPGAAAERKQKAAVFLIALFVFGWFNVLPFLKESGHIRRHGPYHTHVRLAEEFLEGAVEFDRLFYKDIAVFEGRYYSPFPPFPAALLVPFVWLFGARLTTMLLTPWLGALTAVVLYKLLRRLALGAGVSGWAAAGFLFGTVYWLMIREPLDTYFAHVVAVGLVFLALEAAAARRGGLIIGLYMGCAFLSRQLTVLSLPFVWALMAAREPADRTGRWRPVLATVPGLALCLGIYLLYNEVRFHDPLDSGYAYIPEPDWYGSRLARWGVNHWIYIPSNFIRLFLQGFSIEFNDPNRMIPDMSTSGTSLTFASPFLFFAFRGLFRGRPLLNWAGWGGIALCALAVMMNKNAMGGWQINGMRYALDFLPVLLIFAARGMDRAAQGLHRRLWQGAVIYSICLNLLAIVIHYIPKVAALKPACF